MNLGEILIGSGGKNKDLNMSGRKPPKGKKNISMQIDESTYKIMDIFKYNADLLNQGQLIFELTWLCYNSYHITY